MLPSADALYLASRCVPNLQSLRPWILEILDRLIENGFNINANFKKKLAHEWGELDMIIGLEHLANLGEPVGKRMRLHYPLERRKDLSSFGSDDQRTSEVLHFSIRTGTE